MPRLGMAVKNTFKPLLRKHFRCVKLPPLNKEIVRNRALGADFWAKKSRAKSDCHI
jgi:hypothetical protein